MEVRFIKIGCMFRESRILLHCVTTSSWYRSRTGKVATTQTTDSSPQQVELKILGMISEFRAVAGIKSQKYSQIIILSGREFIGGK
jgi:hypothetical protein